MRTLHQTRPTQQHLLVDLRLVLYDYFPSRATRVVNELLSGYSGILQTDGYKSYDAFALEKEIIHAGCLVHCRRKFWEAFKAAKCAKNTFAEQGLEQLKAIYKIEADTKLMSPECRLAHRQLHMAAIFSKFKEWIDTNINKVPTTLKTGEALHYISEQWPKLQHVLRDGRIPLDTNFIEGRIRPLTLGRKNWVCVTKEGSICFKS